MRIKNMVFIHNKKTQSIILKTLEQYWLLNSMYESIDAYTRLNLHSNTPMNGYWSSDIK
jgi:hypothetical protein